VGSLIAHMFQGGWGKWGVVLQPAKNSSRTLRAKCVAGEGELLNRWWRYVRVWAGSAFCKSAMLKS